MRYYVQKARNEAKSAQRSNERGLQFMIVLLCFLISVKVKCDIRVLNMLVRRLCCVCMFACWFVFVHEWLHVGEHELIININQVL